MKRQFTILGIPVQVKNKQLRGAIRQVLLQIRQRRPKDFARLKSQVVAIVPLPVAEAADGTLAEWKRNRINPADFPCGMVRFELDTHRPGKVAVWEDLEEDKQVATLAHEFGHACATSDDERRRNCPSDEWASELAADWYAYRWGFGREIARHRKSRAFAHHAVGPGQTLEECHGDTWYVYRVSRNLCICPP